MELQFAKRLKILRKELDMTQVELAKKLGYGYTAIANYEAGRNEPSLRDLVSICKIFDISADYLLGISDIRKPYDALEKNELELLYKELEKLEKMCRIYVQNKK